jgi:hypothetical protein
MIQSTIEKIEGKLRADERIPEESRKELLQLLAALKPEIAELSAEQREPAESIAGFVERSSHEVLRAQTNPQLRLLSLEALSVSVKDFESSHPDLVKVVNQIATALANLGI